LEALRYPISRVPQEQTRFQIAPMAEKLRVVSAIFSNAMALGAADFFIYCNSLSGALDFESLARERQVRVITPLQVYSQLGKKYGRMGVIAANNQSLAGIERAVLAGNPDAEILGAALIPLVEAVEARIPPSKIVQDMELAELVHFMEINGAQAFILGCTHFPWFQKALAPFVHVPLINPADQMLKNLLHPSSED
jgi:glutamate racemase